MKSTPVITESSLSKQVLSIKGCLKTLWSLFLGEGHEKQLENNQRKRKTQPWRKSHKAPLLTGELQATNECWEWGTPSSPGMTHYPVSRGHPQNIRATLNGLTSCIYKSIHMCIFNNKESMNLRGDGGHARVGGRRSGGGNRCKYSTNI